MPNWTLVEGQLTDGLPMRAYLSEHEGELWSVAIADDQHPCDEHDFASRLGRGLDWRCPKSLAASHALNQAVSELVEYWAGERLEFTFPLRLRGTPFQVRVWQELTRIPFGVTASYGQLANYIGQPTACRAVGAANGRNRLPVFVPCHRVIAASGQLCGFTGGIGLKKRLLAHEAAVLGSQPG